MKKIIISVILLISLPLLASDYSTGVRLFMRKDPDKARTHFLTALENDPSNGNAHYYLGEIEKNKKNYSKAIDYYIKALENRLSNKYLKMTYWNLIILTEQKNDLNGTVKACKVFYKRTGDHSAKQKVDSLINKMLWTNNNSAISAYEKGMEFNNAGKIDEALNEYSKALSEDSAFLAPRFEIGMIEYKRNNKEKAIQNLRIIADKIPFYTASQNLVAKIYMEKKAYRYAIDYYSNVLEYGFINSSIQYNTLVQRGTCYYMTANYSQAENDIQQALKIRKSSKLQNVLSATYIKQRKYDQALKILHSLYAQNKSNPDINFQLGSIYYNQKNNKWIPYFVSLFNSTKNNKRLSTKYQRAHLTLANHYFTEKSYTKSSIIFKSIPLTTLDYKEKNQAAISFYHSNNYSQAITLFESLSLNDNDKLFLARSYLKTGFESKARSTIEHMVLHSSTSEKIVSDPVLGTLAKKIINEEKIKKENERKLEEEIIRKREELKKSEDSAT